MFFLYMVIFMYISNAVSMQSQLDAIEQDYGYLVPYLVKMLKLGISGPQGSPFELFRAFAQDNSVINLSVPGNYMSPSKHVAEIIKKQRIRMGCDYEMKKEEMGEDKQALQTWFIAYFQDSIAPCVKKNLKKECMQNMQQEKNVSNGV